MSKVKSGGEMGRGGWHWRNGLFPLCPSAGRNFLVPCCFMEVVAKDI